MLYDAKLIERSSLRLGENGTFLYSFISIAAMAPFVDMHHKIDTTNGTEKLKQIRIFLVLLMPYWETISSYTMKQYRQMATINELKPT